MSEGLTPQEWQAVIATMQSAPLANMQHAVQRQQLIDKLAVHAGIAVPQEPEPDGDHVG